MDYIKTLLLLSILLFSLNACNNQTDTAEQAQAGLSDEQSEPASVRASLEGQKKPVPQTANITEDSSIQFSSETTMEISGDQDLEQPFVLDEFNDAINSAVQDSIQEEVEKAVKEEVAKNTAKQK